MNSTVLFLVIVCAWQSAAADTPGEKYRLSKPSGILPVGEGGGKHFPLCDKKQAYRPSTDIEIVSQKNGDYLVNGQPWDSRGDADIIKLYKREETEREVFILFPRHESGIAYIVVLVKKDDVPLCGMATEMTFNRR